MSQEKEPIPKQELDIITTVQASQSPPSNKSKNLSDQEQQHLFNDGERGDSFRKHIHCLAIVGIYIVAILIYIMICVRVYHFLVSDCYRWLTDKEVADIERIIFAAGFVSVLGKYFTKYNIIDTKK